MSASAEKELILLREANSALRAENTLLRQKIDLLVKKIFGSSSERLSPGQLELLPMAATPAPVEEKAALAKNRSSSAPRLKSEPRLPENLPVIEEVIEPEPVRIAPQEWRLIGEEVSEQLDYEPGHFLRRRLVRRKYVHRTEVDRAPVIAPLPEKLQERGLAAPGLLAHLIASKYCDHLPLYRQEQIFAHRHKVHLPRQTMTRWMGLCSDWLKPVYEQIRTGVMAGGYVQVDETPIDYLEPGNGKAKQGYLWACARPKGDVVFQWETSRAAACLHRLVPADFTGTLQCDGYAAYPAFVDQRGGGIKLAGCWAHARRGFHDALHEKAATAGWLVRQIQHLYQVEARLRKQRAGPGLREAVRKSESAPVLRRIHKALEALKLSRRILPQSLLGKAIDYALGQWSSLIVYLQDGRIEIDNNLVENAIRPTAIGKKNWLFIGDAEAGERGAILYTIVESCRRRGIDPYAYLRDVLTRLPRMTNWQIKEVTPEAWSKKAASLQVAS